jgi:hypothetical protein
MRLSSVEVTDLTEIRGVCFPKGERFRQIIVTGPPCSGKTTLINALRGWPQEGYLDLAQKNWWRDPILTYRPREVHFGFPFVGFDESHAVFDKEWLKALSDVDLERIQIPPGKRWFLDTDWKNKYTFDFQLPPPNLIFNVLITRAKAGTHPVDAHLTKPLVNKQLQAYEAVARHFHRCGLRVYIRHSFAGRPRRIVDNDAMSNDAGKSEPLSRNSVSRTGS